MGLSWLFLSFEGRINRAIWWGVEVGTTALLIGLISLAGAEANSGLLLAISLGAVALALAPYAKRLHDRNKSGWWVGVFLGLPMILEYYGGSILLEAPEIPEFAWAAALIQIWGLIELGFLPGTSGDNRFGADPLARRRAGGPI